MAQETNAVTHVMVDIETLGTRPGSAIASIGAVVFDPFSEEIGATFERHIDLASCCAAGLAIDPNTVLWWFKQSEEARQATFFGGDIIRLSSALADFNCWLHPYADVRIWAHGAPFDPVILTAAYEASGFSIPWKFWNIRDTRTIFDLAGIKSQNEYRCATDTAHSALSDAIVQARAVGDAYRRLGVKRATA